MLDETVIFYCRQSCHQHSTYSIFAFYYKITDYFYKNNINNEPYTEFSPIEMYTQLVYTTCFICPRGQNKYNIHKKLLRGIMHCTKSWHNTSGQVSATTGEIACNTKYWSTHDPTHLETIYLRGSARKYAKLIQGQDISTMYLFFLLFLSMFLIWYINKTH